MARMGFTALAESESKHYRIRLETSEPLKDGDTWSLTAVAIVSNTNNRTVEDVMVQFYHNGSKSGDPEATEDDGRVTKEFKDLAKGNHVFEAQIVSTDKRARRKITLKDEGAKSSKKIDKLDVTASGGQGRYVISALVSAESRSPIEGATVMFLDGNQAVPVLTEKSGVATYEVNFTEKFRRIVVQTAGLEAVVLTLKGPPIKELVRLIGEEESTKANGWRAGARAMAAHKGRLSREEALSVLAGRKPTGLCSFFGQFRASNNFRANCLLGLAGILLAFNLIVFTLGAPEKPDQSAYTLTEQRWENFQKYGEPLTYEEMHGKQTDWRQEWGGGFWKVWWLLFLSGVFYRIVAQRDEIAMFFTRERTAIWRDLPDEPKNPETKIPSSVGSLMPSGRKIVTETVAEIGAEAVNEIAAKALRKIIKR